MNRSNSASVTKNRDHWIPADRWPGLHGQQQPTRTSRPRTENIRVKTRTCAGLWGSLFYHGPWTKIDVRITLACSSIQSFENVLRKFKIFFVTVKFQHENFPLPGSYLDFFKVQIRIWPWMTFTSSYHFNLQEPSLVSKRHFKKCQRGLNWKRRK